MNTTLDNSVFSVDVPKDATPLTLEELRRAGPLGAERRHGDDLDRFGIVVTP